MLTHPKNAPVKLSTRKTSNELYQDELAIMILLVSFEDVASKLFQVSFIFILAIHSYRRQETFSVQLKKKIDHYIWNSLDAKTPFCFEKISKQRSIAVFKYRYLSPE